MIFFRAIRYLNYILLARHSKGHGIHSPFVFDIVSRIFRNKIDPEVVSTIEMVRKRLIADKRIINDNDQGAGSDRIKNRETRKVSDIARYSPVPKKYGALLFSMASEFGNPSMIELGTSLGISGMYMASGCRNSILNTIEGSPQIAEIARENFREAGIENIILKDGLFDEILPQLLSSQSNTGLVFIDGNHRKEPVLNYFRQIAEKSCSSTVIIIDDIHYSREMEEAWNEIMRFDTVSVTIDIFRMGIVFFRRGVTHNNYIIRY